MKKLNFSRMTIRGKVALWVVVCLIVLAGLTFFTVMRLDDAIMSSTAEHLLTEFSNLNAAQVEYKDGNLAVSEDFVSEAGGAYFALYSDGQELLDGQLPPGVVLDEPFEDGTLRVCRHNSMDTYLYDRQLYLGNDILWLRATFPAGSTSFYNNGIIKATFFMLPFFVAFSAAIAYLIARQAYEPIEQLRRVTEEISRGEDLSRRVAVGNKRDEVSRLAETINSMLARLERSFETERQFVADASHELRTPLAVILAQCEEIMRDGGLPESADRGLLSIERHAAKMNKMIQSLLLLTRLENGVKNLTFQDIDFSELLSELCCGIKLIHSELEFNIEPSVHVRGNTELLTRMVANLLSNAVKFSPEDAKITVSLEKQGDCAVFRVKDLGEGIAPEELGKIWNRFYQVDSVRRSSSEGSMGLGLAMVKQIVKTHGGVVSAESVEGVGSSFTAMLPLIKI
ncbi:MAG: HAMP domain-containing histidine kinase [Clostridium sp.]|jgi:signal transduction histidine kinase|nr:HAMP domain-containing histidine kinase [Clostridium sp.]